MIYYKTTLIGWWQKQIKMENTLQKVEGWIATHAGNGHLISDKGNIFGSYRSVMLTQKKNSAGYLFVMFKGKPWYVHRLVAMAFIPNPENKKYVNHKNGIKTDNRVENLEWVTGSENMIHARDSGLLKSRKGENNPLAKLSDKEVIQIRQLVSSGLKQKDVAKIFTVHPTNISKIINRKSRP